MNKKMMGILMLSFWVACVISAPLLAAKKNNQTSRLKLAKELIITDDSLPEGLFFSNPFYICSFKDKIYIADSSEHHIVVFDFNGNFLKTIGKLGQGPGDLNSPNIVEVFDDGLVVSDSINRRISLLTHDGEFIHSIPISYETGIPHKIRILSDGKIIIEYQKYQVKGNSIDFNLPQICSLELYSNRLEHMKTIYSKKAFLIKKFLKPSIEIRRVFNPRLSWEITDDDKLIIGFSDKYEIEVWNPMEDRLLSFKHEYSPVPVTKDDTNDFFSKLKIFYVKEGRRTQGAPDDVVKNMTFPKHKPPFKGITTDSDGNIWVGLYSEYKENRNQIFDIFDSAGNYMKSVTMDSLGWKYSINARVRDKSIWKIEWNDEEFFEIIRYHLM